MIDRRGFIGLTSVALVGLAEDWLNLDPAELVAVLQGGRISDDFVDQIEIGLPRLRTLEAAYGGDRARKLLDAELGMVTEVLAKSSYSAPVARRLHGLAAELGRMAGWASFDSRLHSAAQRYWVAALHAAHAANDRPLGANILKSMSLQCHDFGRLDEALALARSARTGAGEITPHTRAMLTLREARAHAALGDAAACQRLLSMADTQLGQGPNPDDPPWIAYFDESEFHAQAASCYLDLGHPKRADEYLDKAFKQFPSAKVRDQATYLTQRVRAQIALRDHEQAADLLASAVPLLQQAPSRRNVARAFAVRNCLPGNARRDDLDAQLAAVAA
jgi:tetratricopeptide (TPR) repeat protein